MRYMGSKRLIANDMLNIMLANRDNNQYFIDMFCGGCNIAERVDGNVIANDIHFELIEMYKAVKKGWIPPQNISLEEYKQWKTNTKKNEAHIKGFVGFGCSYGGKYFDGFARAGASSKPRNYCLESRNNIIKQAPKLSNIKFYNLSYEQVKVPNNSIIYCDIPYENTKKYVKTKRFEHDKFFRWAIDMSLKKHIVFISEQKELDNRFLCVFKKEVKRIVGRFKANTVAEKLYLVKNDFALYKYGQLQLF